MIWIVWAPPRQGKTYVMTDEIVATLLHTKRRVFTNWPIVIRKTDGTVITSRVWTPDLSHENIQGSDVYVDEAYMDYNSREYKKFEKDVHTFFATNGHNDNNITLIAQNPARIDVVIREMCNGFLLVKKVQIPGIIWWAYAHLMNQILKGKYGTVNPSMSRPLFFVIYNYLTEKDMASRKPEAAYSAVRVWFNDAVAQAYNTHYFRTKGNAIYEGETWASVLKIPQFPPAVPIDNSLSTSVKKWWRGFFY